MADNFRNQINTARRAGYSDDELIEYLNGGYATYQWLYCQLDFDSNLSHHLLVFQARQLIVPELIFHNHFLQQFLESAQLQDQQKHRLVH